jgi:hypothetical protein
LPPRPTGHLTLVPLPTFSGDLGELGAGAGCLRARAQPKADAMRRGSNDFPIRHSAVVHAPRMSSTLLE